MRARADVRPVFSPAPSRGRLRALGAAGALVALSACGAAPADEASDSDVTAVDLPAAARFHSDERLTDIDNAVYFGQMAKLAYASEKEIQGQTTAFGIERFKFFQTDATMRAEWEREYGTRLPDAQGFVALVIPANAPSERVVVIAYRGTDSTRDFFIDADVRKTPADAYSASEDALVHKGFLLQAKVLWARIEATVWDFVLTPSGRALGQDPAALRRCVVSPTDARCAKAEQDRSFRPVFFTGHSLGGAVAAMAASRVISPKTAEEGEALATQFRAPLPSSGRGFPIGGIVTFGQPRVGNQAFADVLRRRLGESTHASRTAFGAPYVRFVNENDFVPMVPPHVMGFRHGGAEAWYAHDGAALSPHCSAWNDTWKQALRNAGTIAMTPVGDLVRARDHGMDRYLTTLGEAQKLVRSGSQGMTCR